MIEKETILKIKQIELEEKRRYDNNKLLRYNTGKKIHKKQLLFHQTNKKTGGYLGGIVPEKQNVAP